MIFSIGLASAGLGPWLYARLSDPSLEMKNEQALLTESSVAILLTLAFYLIQNQNNIKRKQFWLKVAYDQINAIIDIHNRASMYCKQVVIDNSEQSIARASTNLAGDYDYLENLYIPKLDQAITQIADLLDDPSVYESISHGNYDHFKRLVRQARENLNNINETQQSARHCKEVTETFAVYRDRIEKEMPSKTL